MNKFELRRSVEGGIVVILGVVILLLIPSQITSVVLGETQMSPSFIPTVVAVGLILAGLGLLAKAYFTKSEHPPLDLTVTGLLRMLTAVLLLVAYTWLFPRVGFVVTSGVFLGVFIVFFGSRRWLRIVLNMVLVPIVLWLFFEQLFRIPLPHGFLF